ncbi:hypothetical protein AB1Y20_009628 [Prymnesium parvum]|uniref:Cytosolic carboxypeptidase-like protein 5 n=1 Tax=Prymnesium parvum TaxID=97485 RepID=A0AB34K5P0_PRYPA
MPPPSVCDVSCGGVTFNSAFDSGNLARVEQRDASTFAVWTRSDGEGTPHVTPFRTWFHFSVQPGAARGKLLSFEVHNMNPQGKLFKPSYDMRPVWRALPSRPEWSRLPLPCHHTGVKEEDNFVLHFRHKCECELGDTLYFALSYPHSYTECLARYARLDALFALPPVAVVAPEAATGGATCRSSSSGESLSEAPRAASLHSGKETMLAAMAAATSGPCQQDAARELATAATAAAVRACPKARPSNVYYHRELLMRSVQGRRIDLITISGTSRMLKQVEDPIPGCFPEGGERPRRFEGKPVFLMSARVHPGEVPASHVFEGLVSFLLREHDPRAQALRDRYVFKLIPLLNPDGVFHGCYRADTLGVNLNRCYSTCTAEAQPSIFGATALVRQLHERGELMFYVDTHGHASKRGCFFYGNELPYEQQVESVLFAKLVALNSRWFDFQGSVFNWRASSRPSKEGSGRVYTHKVTNLTHIYTLECNYNMGRHVNRLTPQHLPNGVSPACMSPPPAPLRSLAPKYSPATWADVGKAIGLAALDLFNANPATRLGPPTMNGLDRMRSTVQAWVRSQERKKKLSSKDEDEEEEDEDEGEPWVSVLDRVHIGDCAQRGVDGTVSTGIENREHVLLSAQSGCGGSSRSSSFSYEESTSPRRQISDRRQIS